MKCPNCGTVNGKTNKFCRECGLRIEHLAVADESAKIPEAECAPDEVALGGDLFEVWKLYESGDLDKAAETVNRAIDCYPDSASAHSLLALIYERKAELETRVGEEESARAYLRMAVDQFERIIDLNPDSAADRKKLADLRMKLTGVVEPEPAKAKFDLKAVVAAIPFRAKVAAATFFAIVFLTTMLIPGQKRTATVKVTPAGGGYASKPVDVASTPAESSSFTEPGNSNLKVYTFPTASNPAPPAQAASRSSGPPKPDTEKIPPAKLPAIDSLTLAPEKSNASKAKVTKAETSSKPKPAVAGGSKPAAESRINGSDLYATALELQDQGRTEEAVSMAEQAISVWNADIDAGRDNGSAKRGIENASKSIKLWKQLQAVQGE